MGSVTGLAESYNFGDLKDSPVTDMIVYHCKNETLRARLLKKPESDLNRVIENAKIEEETIAQVQEIQGGSYQQSGERGLVASQWPNGRQPGRREMRRQTESAK